MCKVSAEKSAYHLLGVPLHITSCFSLVSLKNVSLLLGLLRWLSGKKLPKAGDMGSTPGSGRSLEKEMATHSNILAWAIPWTEETGMVSQMSQIQLTY